MTDEEKKQRDKERCRRYNQSEKGKAKVKRYQQSEKGKEAKRRAWIACYQRTDEKCAELGVCVKCKVNPRARSMKGNRLMKRCRPCADDHRERAFWYRLGK